MAPPLAALRIICAILIAGWLAPVLTAGLAGLGVPIVLAGAAAVILAGAATAWAVWMRRGADWILEVFLAGPRIWLVVIVAAAIAACVWNGRLTVFMIDSSRVNCSYEPGDPFLTDHSCFSAYAEAARFAEAGGVNIYDARLYAPETTAGPRRLIGGKLRVDPYHYPPPFLLLPGAIRLAAPEFPAARAVWFMVQSLLLAAALVMVSRWIGGVPGAWAAASGWLLLASPAVLMTLQAGNFQVTVYSLAIIAFVLVSTGRDLTGAAILAYATAGKIVPGVLVLFLLTARRWRVVAYTAAFSLLLCALTVAWFGWTPMRDFIWYEMPQLASGEAFPQTERVTTPLMNLSVYGETVRLRKLLAAWFGVNWFGPEVGRPIASLYGIIVVFLTAGAGWLVGKRGWLTKGTEARDEEGGLAPETRIRLAQMVLALLSLTAFRSPFVGSIYGYLGTMWLLTLLAAEASTTKRRVGWLAGFGLVAAVMLLMPPPARPQTMIAPTLPWFVVSSVAFSSVLLLNLGVVARGMAIAWRREVDADAPLGAAVAARAGVAVGISGGPAGGRPGL